MNNNVNVKIFVIVIIVLVLGVAGLALVNKNSTAGSTKYDAFAQCLKDKGAIFYGAFWCPHCQAQKKLFGASVKLLPYHECSTADGAGQLQECIDAKITGYPTWQFADGSRLNGEIPLATLAEKTGCTLPVEGTNVK
jgi:hypothetical protein